MMAEARPIHRCSEVTDSAPILLHFPSPIGWIALTADELARARARAAEHILDFGVPSASSSAIATAARELLSPADAARALAVDASWLLRRAREGAIPHVRLGKYVRFDLAALIGQCTKHPSARRDTRIG